MGSLFTTPSPDESFVTGRTHKLYIILPTTGDFFKLGYTSTTVRGLWRYYRRSYGKGMTIHRLYPCTRYKEDDALHDELQQRHGVKNGGRELYRRESLKEVTSLLDKRYPGVGPYTRDDLVRFRDGLPVLTHEEVIIAKTKKLSLNPH